MKYDFDEPVRRRGTNCVKWDVCAEGVLPLWVADMDFRAAPAIVEALRRRAEEGVYGYALPPAAWHESLAKWLAARHGWNILPEWAVDSTGVLPTLGAVLRACCEPGDKVVLQAPAYNGFFPVIASQGCEISWSPLRRVPARSGMKGDFTYEMDFEDLERKVADPRAKVFLISNPHNPAGRAWTAEELRKAGEICRRNGVLVASGDTCGSADAGIEACAVCACRGLEAGRVCDVLVRHEGIQPRRAACGRGAVSRPWTSREGARCAGGRWFGPSQCVRICGLRHRVGLLCGLA